MPLSADISNNNPHFWTDLPHLLDLGVERFQVGLQYPSRDYPPGQAHIQIPMIINAGKELEVYAESQRVQDVWWRVKEFEPHILRAWQAVEEGFVDAVYLRAAFEFMDVLNLPNRAGKYTGDWFYGPRHDELAEFDDRPDWIANYNLKRDLIIPITAGESDGVCVMHQFQGDYVLPSGDKCDLSWYEDSQMLTYQTLTQSEDIAAVKAQVTDAIGADGGGFIARITSGYTPKPGNKALLIEVKDN